jgi:intein-encoded DNA endonuclease-like protein
MNNIKKLLNHVQIFKDHYLIDKWSTVRIGKFYNIAPTTVSKILRENNILVKSREGSGRKRTYEINHNYFNVIDSENKAYILGFIYADGYITDKNKLGISLNIKDENILLRIKKEMSSEYPLHYFNSSYSKDYKSTGHVRFLINSEQIYNDLYNMGCITNKSDTLTFPANIPKHLIHHFIRGYFDGDGSVYNRSVYNNYNTHYNSLGFSFIGTKEFLEQIVINLPFETNAKLYKEKRTTKNVWEFKTGGIERSKIFYNWLYKDSTIFLDRKKQKFEQFLKLDVQRL